MVNILSYDQLKKRVTEILCKMNFQRKKCEQFSKHEKKNIILFLSLFDGEKKNG